MAPCNIHTYPNLTPWSEGTGQGNVDKDDDKSNLL